MEFEEKVGEDILLELSNTFSDEHYAQIRNFYILNTYIILSEVFDEIAEDILQFEIPMADKVHVFANEYDCEHFSIYELQTTWFLFLKCPYINISHQKITMHALYFVDLRQNLNKTTVNHVLLQVGTTLVHWYISLVSSLG